MKIFKFGGASVKDADGVKNLVNVLQEVGYDNTLIVISAMGKTTNAIEVVIKNYFEESSKNYKRRSRKLPNITMKFYWIYFQTKIIRSLEKSSRFLKKCKGF